MAWWARRQVALPRNSGTFSSKEKPDTGRARLREVVVWVQVKHPQGLVLVRDGRNQRGWKCQHPIIIGSAGRV